MLLSLGAGGVGLNLTGANHLFLLDMHWNPQLEKQVCSIIATGYKVGTPAIIHHSYYKSKLFYLFQACDRIYRVGQTKEVYIHKFLCEETIERRILDLQEKKLALADGVLTGAKSVNSSKLSFEDLKALFSMGANEKSSMVPTDDDQKFHMSKK